MKKANCFAENRDHNFDHINNIDHNIDQTFSFQIQLNNFLIDNFIQIDLSLEETNFLQRELNANFSTRYVCQYNGMFQRNLMPRLLNFFIA
jgi:hypothetical protein